MAELKGDEGCVSSTRHAKAMVSRTICVLPCTPPIRNRGCMHNLTFSWSTFLSYCRTLTTVLDASWSWKKAISHNWTLQILTLVQTLASMSAAPQTSLGLKNRRLFCGCVVTWPHSGLSSVCWQKSWSWWSSSWFTRNARGQTRCQTVGYAKFLFFTQNYSSMSYMTHL